MKRTVKRTLVVCALFVTSTTIILLLLSALSTDIIEEDKKKFDKNDDKDKQFNITTMEPWVDHFANFQAEEENFNMDIDEKWSNELNHPWKVNYFYVGWEQSSLKMVAQRTSDEIIYFFYFSLAYADPNDTFPPYEDIRKRFVYNHTVISVICFTDCEEHYTIIFIIIIIRCGERC